ncbi:hypothetical protein GCM10022224_098660 [Nonomuraea antimicrobica]|uniref:Uncharacterized protein n=1 Tax=Nonomuraea antimicrobica TaxID=561173 RepID=A0ABP7ECH8_9ACTN
MLAEAGLADCQFYRPDGCELRADLPAGRGTYTLSAEMRRQVPYAALSTSVESVWTFPALDRPTHRGIPF